MTLAAVLLSLALVHAEPPPQMRVNVADLDFGRAEDQARFQQRLDAAASAFCQSHRAVVTPSHVRARGWCEREMRAEVLQALPRPVRLALRRGAPD